MPQGYPRQAQAYPNAGAPPRPAGGHPSTPHPANTQPPRPQQGFPGAPGRGAAPDYTPYAVPRYDAPLYAGANPDAQRYAASDIEIKQYQPAPENPKKGRKKRGSNRKAWTTILVIALTVLVLAAAAVAYIFYTYWNGEREYEELTQYMQVDDSETVTTLASFNVDWDALRAINADVVGWVYVPGTVINYPIVWKEGDDNYYMKHNFGRNSVGGFGAEYGAIMLASINSPKWTDRASFISGHHMNNGQMFAVLQKFMDSTVFNEHRTFFVLTPEGNFKCTSFAVDKVLGSSDDIVIPNFATKAEFRAYVQARIDQSVVTPDPPGPTASEIEQVMMFYTCNEPDNRYRVCVYTSVDEFLPAGSDVSLGNALINEGDLGSVGSAVGERLL